MDASHQQLCASTGGPTSIERYPAARLYIASQFEVDVVSLCLDRGADVNAAENFGRTSLFVASGQGHVDVATLLLDRGADVNRANQNGAPPLYIASQAVRVAVATLLLDRGADVDRAKHNGTTSCTSPPRWARSPRRGYSLIAEPKLTGWRTTTWCRFPSRANGARSTWRGCS